MQTHYLKALFIILLSLSHPIAAETIRCHGKLIQVGMSDYDVKRLCGEPKDKKAFEVIHSGTNRANITTIQMERWIYQPSTQSFQRVLLFKNGILNSITTKSRH